MATATTISIATAQQAIPKAITVDPARSSGCLSRVADEVLSTPFPVSLTQPLRPILARPFGRCETSFPLSTAFEYKFR